MDMRSSSLGGPYPIMIYMAYLPIQLDNSLDDSLYFQWFLKRKEAFFFKREEGFYQGKIYSIPFSFETFTYSVCQMIGYSLASR